MLKADKPNQSPKALPKSVETSIEKFYIVLLVERIYNVKVNYIRLTVNIKLANQFLAK